MPKEVNRDLVSRYKRTPDELREHASMFWPSEMSEKEAKISVIPFSHNPEQIGQVHLLVLHR